MEDAYETFKIPFEGTSISLSLDFWTIRIILDCIATVVRK